MENEDLEKDKVVTCDKCGDYQGTSAQVRGHKMRCNGKEEIEIIPDVVPVREREAPQRNRRVPFGVPQKKLSFTPDDNDNRKFVYRYMNDGWMQDPDRVNRAMQGGYEKVQGYNPVLVGTNKDGSPIKAVLMRIPREWYDEDQKEKRKEIDKVDKAIQGGTLEQQANDNRYTPQGIKMYSNANPNG